MEIVGTVIAVSGETATVNVRRTSACGENCAHCSGSCESTTAQAVATNTVGAAVGDVVKIESNTSDVVRAAFFLYMLPVLVAIIVAVAAFSSGVLNILVVLFSAMGFFISFFIVKKFEKKLTPKSYITKIYKKG